MILIIKKNCSKSMINVIKNINHQLWQYEVNKSTVQDGEFTICQKDI